MKTWKRIEDEVDDKVGGGDVEEVTGEVNWEPEEEEVIFRFFGNFTLHEKLITFFVGYFYGHDGGLGGHFCFCSKRQIFVFLFS